MGMFVAFIAVAYGAMEMSFQQAHENPNAPSLWESQGRVVEQPEWVGAGIAAEG